MRENKSLIFENVYKWIFKERLNRFVWRWYLNWKQVLFHIGDTGRLGELLKDWNSILIQQIDNKNNKYNYRLLAAKGLFSKYVFVNSLYHSKLVKNFLIQKGLNFKAEVKLGDSRIDFLINNDIFVEIKWCSLVKSADKLVWKKLIKTTLLNYLSDYVGLFPDAPTKRWNKHMQKLIDLLVDWRKAEVWFLMMNKVKWFYPNFLTDRKFEELFFKFLNNWWRVRFLFVDLDYKNKILSVKLTTDEFNLQWLY